MAGVVGDLDGFGWGESGLGSDCWVQFGQPGGDILVGLRLWVVQGGL